jgi:peptidase A4-like protein
VIRHVVAVSTIGLLGLGPAASTAGSTAAHVVHRPILAIDASQSSNWSGYNQGSQEQGGTLFNRVAGSWIVPRATQHKAGEAEFSSSWIGIGGGCVDANCTITDSTLIQTGTEQDVAANGQGYYSA